MTASLSRNVALRIGLASRVLPTSVSIGDLIDILQDAVGLPLSDEKLDGLTMKMFRKAAGERMLSVPVELQKTALSHLRGETGTPENDPAIASYAESEMPHSLRIACASNGGDRLDGHFGTCKRFLIYQVSETEIRLIDIRSCAEGEDAEDKNAWRAALISDCQVVQMISIGGPAAAKVVKANIHPLKRPEAIDAPVAMAELQKVIAGQPAPWLARAMGREAGSLKPFIEMEPEQ